jgi:hypothetical protein
MIAQSPLTRRLTTFAVDLSRVMAKPCFAWTGRGRSARLPSPLPNGERSRSGSCAGEGALAASEAADV